MCNYAYAGTELINIGESKIQCECGLSVFYEPPLIYYWQPKDSDAPGLRELIQQLKELHNDSG